MNTTTNEIANFSFTNFTPRESDKKKCIQMCRRIKANNRGNNIEIKLNFFIEKHAKFYKAVGIVTVMGKIFVYSSANVHLLTTLLNVESGLRKQLDSRYEHKVPFRYAV